VDQAADLPVTAETVVRFLFPMPHLVRLKATVQPWEASITGADQARLAKRAEELGYDMLGIPEHFIIPREHVDLSGPHYFHAAAAQGFFAGATQRIRINSALTILPLQNPIVTAKAYSTIDWLSGGRITVTFGVGWLEREFELLRVPFHERGRMADEYLAAIIELWTQDCPSFEGQYVTFNNVAFEPKPLQKPHVPIWMGGDADAVLKRAARYASGWMPFLTKPEDIPARIDFIKSQPSFKGGPFDVSYGVGTSRVGEGHRVIKDPRARPGMSAQEIIDRLSWLKRLGVTHSAVPIPAVNDIAAYLEYAQWVMEEIKPNVS
jgi:probable F420-dependent oxidoreductase